MTMMRVILVAAMATFATAHAQDAELTAKLQAKVAELSGMQQASLLLFLDKLGGAAEAPAAAAAVAATPESSLKASIKEFKEMVANKSFDITKLFANISEDFSHPAVGDKEGAIAFLQGAKDSGLINDDILAEIEISIEDAEFEVDGDEVEIYPIDIDSPLGSITIGLYGKNENGVWRVTEIDGV